MIRSVLFFCFWFVFVQGQEPPAASNELSYTISKLWNGYNLTEGERISVTLVGDQTSLDVKVNIRAPFYGDPVPNALPGEVFKYLWKAEVVEVYFLNDDDQYLQIQFGPYGHQTTHFFNGSRIRLSYESPLEYEAIIAGPFWFGTAVIPGDYFPPEVTKFNAAAINGYVNFTQGHFSMLYPADQTSIEPDFHNLSLFEPIPMSTLSPEFENSSLSSVWEALLNGERNYVITKTWDLKDLPVQRQVKIVVGKVPRKDGIRLKIEAPFYNDTAPPAEPGSKFIGLWAYEVVEAYFLNDDDQYLQLQIAPQGQYAVFLFNGRKNGLPNELSLNVTSNIVESTWSAEVFVPKEYFPPAVTKASFATQHGPVSDRRYYTLTPNPVVLDAPDFHNLPYFMPFQMNDMIDNRRGFLSTTWNTALENEFRYVIGYTWDGKPIPKEERAKVNLEAVEGSLDMAVRIEAPFYDDPAPDVAPGETFNDLANYEAVEVYLVNAADQYLQIQVAPRGQYFVIFFDGERNMIRHTLPLNVSTSIQGSRWTADIVIPGEYLPEKITKFNAAATHGPENDRKYNLRSPTFYPEATVPDYHNLDTYKTVAIENLSPIYKMASMSRIWRAALAGQSLFVIDNTLDGQSLSENEEVAVSLQRVDNSSDIYVRVEAPFYNDTVPSTEPGQYQAIWKYEVVDLYFLNKEDLYLQIQVSPYGQYWVLLFNGTRNEINTGLPLNVTSTISDSAWSAETTIPGDYFPPEVRLFNAAAMHGEGIERQFLSLNALPAGATQEEPDFHDFRLFQPFDIREHVHGNESDDSAISAVWENALQSPVELTTLESV